MPTALVLNSWAAAVAYCSTFDWQNFLFDRANDYRDRLRVTSVSTYNRWNQIADPVRAIALPLIQDKTRDVVDRWGLPEIFIWNVGWGLVHMGIELEFSETCPPGFLTDQAAWYLSGHFPCGWEGPFPAGRPIIY